MNKQIRELSRTKPDGEADKGASTSVKAELGEEELSQVSGGKTSSLALKCATGKHFAAGKITVWLSICRNVSGLAPTINAEPEVQECQHKAGEAKVLPRGRAAHVNQYLQAAVAK
jgi:hypothetical protein